MGLSDGESLQYQIEELQQRATKDTLSGLLNRATMEQHIKRRLQRMEPDETCALFIVDLDNFKSVNDTLGHQAGDRAIHLSARILSGLFRPNDIVGRLGGDEFAVFLCGDITEEFTRKKAAEICESLHLALGDQTVVNLTASVGVYLADRGQAFEGLYQAADLALYKAKKAGKHRFFLKDRDGYREARSAEFRPVSTIPLSGLLENMDSGVALLELGDAPQVIYVSPSFCRIIGADPGKLELPIPLARLIHPDDLVAVEREIREAQRLGRPADSTHRVSSKRDDGWLWWYVRATEVEYDSPHPVMLITATDISQLKESELELKETNQRLQAAFDQTSKRIWEVDIHDGTFRAFTRDGKYQPLGGDNMKFPEHLITGGWIHPNSVTRFRRFAQELLSGRAQGYGNFAVRSRDTGHYSWASISYRTIFDDVGRAVRAVGVLESLPQGFASQGSWGSARRPLPEGLVADLIVRMCANLESDTVEDLWIEGSNLSSQVEDTRCSQVMQLERQKVFSQDGPGDLETLFDREELLRAYQEGRRWLSAEYRRVDSGGNIRWVRHVLYLSEEPSSHQLHIFVYLVRVDRLHQLELSVSGGAQRDPVSRLYDRDTVRHMAEALFAERSEGNRAVAVFQINGLVRQPMGAIPGAWLMLSEIASALSLALGGGCILGQYSPSQFVVVFPSVTGREDTRRRMEEAMSFLRRTLPGSPFDALLYIAGISISPARTASYSLMLSQAERICAFWWNAAADTVAFSQESEDWLWPQQQQDCDSTEQVAVHSSEMDRPLSEREKDVALDCVSAMLAARTLDASLKSVLQTIGGYYHADRVYTLMLVENGHALVMTFEWTAAGKRSIQQAVSGTRLERFPLLTRCMEERAPMFLTRRHLHNAPGSDSPAPDWYFTAFPLIRGTQVEGFLCIENAREHPGDAALFSTLIPHMLRERERFSSIERASGAAEQLLGLPDLRAYMDAIYSLSSERFSSLGAVCLDIPGFAAINSSCGFEYGSRLLWYVAKTLSEVFGTAFLFRTWDAEFIAFLPNTTREVFLGRCGRLRSILQRRYPKEVRIGRAWADGAFTGQRLVKEAKASMHAEPLEPDAGAPQFEEFSTVGDAARAGRFTVYFQPKIDLRTGALAGAEVLVRGIDNNGAIVMPATFIEMLEETGTVRELDLFVLERALAQADRWRSQGLGIVPVAVNISRVTLVHPSTLASVLAVQSHYPQLPPEALELEITERGGLETGELRAIVERFRSCGLHIGLDDFGSQYANLSLFASVRFDTVKLDRSLMADLVTNPIGRTLVRDIVRICKNHGMVCVAEGVETAAQRDTLLELGCRYAQGYYYDRPLPCEAFENKYLRPRAEADTQGKEERT